MPSTGVDFWATPTEVAEIFREISALDGITFGVHLFPPREPAFPSVTETMELIIHSDRYLAVFFHQGRTHAELIQSGDKITDFSDALVLRRGRLLSDSLEYSSLDTLCYDEAVFPIWKKIVSSFRRRFAVGGFIEFSNQEGSNKNERYFNDRRFLPEAIELYESGFCLADSGYSVRPAPGIKLPWAKGKTYRPK